MTEQTRYGLHVTAVTRAEDGQPLDISRKDYTPTEAGLPDEKKLAELSGETGTNPVSSPLRRMSGVRPGGPARMDLEPPRLTPG